MKIELTQEQAFAPFFALAKIVELQTIHFRLLFTMIINEFTGHAHLLLTQIKEGRQVQIVLLNFSRAKLMLLHCKQE